MGENELGMVKKRGGFARIGICLLNLLQPGLGLLRLANYRAAALFILLNLVAIAWIVMLFSSTLPATYAGYLSFLSLIFAGLGIILILYGGSILLSWRQSAMVLPRSGWFWRWYAVMGVAVLLIVLTSPFSDLPTRRYRNFYAPSGSMAPALEPGDRFIASTQHFDRIARGDVVIVQRNDTEYVKRVVGVPGDTVAMRGGAVVLNGSLIALQPLDKVTRDDGIGKQTAQRLREQFPGEARPHDIFDLGTTPQDTTPEVRLGAGQYFLLGDHRDNSLDSRFPIEMEGLGIVDRSRIKGRVLFRYWRNSTGLGEGSM